MKTSLIFHEASNRRVILLFSGWSTTPVFYSGLNARGWDIMLVYDYSSPDFDAEILCEYSTVYILAWSLGVAAAEKIAGKLPLHLVSAAFAVNGTLFPADDARGIPDSIYDGTRSNLSQSNLRRFRRRMAPAHLADSEFMLEQDLNPDFAITRLQKELEALRNPAMESLLPWKRTYIGKDDRIFPPLNQIRAWKEHPSRPQIVSLPEGHWIDLQQTIHEITPDHSGIARRFSRAVSTYDNNASAQQHIVRRLISLLNFNNEIISAPDLLEIGPGSGRLTRELGRRIHPASATFVDLYPLPQFGIAPKETYITGDAEEWMENAPEKTFGIVASASVIQWFADPRRFFRNVRRVLRPGGLFLCSTFLTGNLAELDVLRPAPLLYRSREELEGMLNPLFPRLELREETIQLDFDSPKDALLHLKLTGVGGGTHATVRNLLTALPQRPRLTYRCLYIKASLENA